MGTPGITAGAGGGGGVGAPDTGGVSCVERIWVCFQLLQDTFGFCQGQVQCGERWWGTIRICWKKRICRCSRREESLTQSGREDQEQSDNLREELRQKDLGLFLAVARCSLLRTSSVLVEVVGKKVEAGVHRYP